MILKIFVATVIMYKASECGASETESLREISTAIGVQVLACRETNHFGLDIIDAFWSYWDGKFYLDDTNMGCVIHCVLGRLELLDPNGGIQEANAQAFGKANGADDRTIKGLIQLYKICQKGTKTTESCEFGLYMASCFRAGVMQVGWAPSLNASNPLNTEDEL